MTYHDKQKYEDGKKFLVISIMVIGISGLHLLVSNDLDKSLIVARELYFLPIILSAFWFGIRGAATTALTISAFYFVYSLLFWRKFSGIDLNRLLDIVLFNIIAISMGLLRDRLKTRSREKRESIRALAATVGHEMNSPLFVGMGTLELLQDDFDQDSSSYLEIENVMKNLHELKVLILKISQLQDVVTKDYDGSSKVVDLDKSSTTT